MSRGKETTIIGVIGDEREIDFDSLGALPHVDRAMPVLKPFKYVSREVCPQDRIVNVKGVEVVKDLVFIAGSYSVEDEDTTLRIAERVRQAGAAIFRAGAYKPRTSPWSFQGLYRAPRWALKGDPRRSIVQLLRIRDRASGDRCASQYRTMTEPGTSQETPSKPNEGSVQALRNRVAELEEANRKLEAELARQRDVTVSAKADRQTMEARVEQRAADLEQTVGALADEAKSRARAEEALSERSLALDETSADLRNKVELLDLAHDTILVHDPEGRIVFWNRGAERTYGWTKAEVLGKTSHDLLRTEFSDSLVRLMAELLRDDYWEGVWVHTARDGRRIVVASRWALRRDDAGEPVAILEIDNDITQRREAEAKAEAERKRLFSLLNLLPGYVVLVDRRHGIRYANHGFLEAFSEPSGRPCYEVLYGLGSPCEDCAMARVMDEEKRDSWEQTCPDGRTYQVWAFPFVDADGTRLMLELGIDVTRRKDLELQVAEASEVERRKIGRDLHDMLGQSLTGLGYLIGGLADRLVDRSPQDAAAAEQLVETVNEAVGQVRALSRGLDPIGLDADGLINALDELAETFQNTSGIPCEFSCNCTVSLSEFTATHLYRIAQEALNNVARHAQAQSVAVELTDSDGQFVLKIEDGGVGISDEARDSEGMGLRTMRYRASAIGARLTIRPAAGGGTVVTCTLSRPAVETGKED